MNRSVPQEDLDKLEIARKNLWKFLEKETNVEVIANISLITQSMYKLSHSRYTATAEVLFE